MTWSDEPGALTMTVASSSTRFVNLVDVVRPAGQRSARVFDILMVLAGSALIGLCAQIAVPLWFTPVPLTGQTFAVLLVAATLGPVRGGAAVAIYLAEGAIGLPVLAGGAGGFARMFGATGGYLAGFLVAAVMVGWLAQHACHRGCWSRSVLATALAMLAGEAVILACGAVWLARAGDLGVESAIAMGVTPFVPGALIKAALATALLPAAWRFVNR
jgi:biotin transport system substrate-specific component